MKRLLPICVLSMGAGCSEPPAPPMQSTEVPTATVAQPQPAAAPEGSGAASAQGSALTGAVSGLSGDVSQLQGLVDALGGEIREREIYVALPADTLFAFDKADILPAAEGDLRTLATLIGKTTQGMVELRGYTDAKGEDAYNLALSKRRADAIKAWLISHDVAEARLQARGLGEANPVAPNEHPDGSDDPEGRARNRRVEAIIPRN